MEKIDFIIDGMSCTSCSSGLEKSLKNIDGIESVTVSFVEKKATIVYDKSKVDKEQLIQEIYDAGFDAK